MLERFFSVNKSPHGTQPTFATYSEVIEPDLKIIFQNLGVHPLKRGPTTIRLLRRHRDLSGSITLEREKENDFNYEGFF